MLIGISTPYRKSGLLYRKFRESYGVDDDDVLVIRAPSIVMNPTLDQVVIEQEIAADPAKNKAEYLAEWRDDISGWAPRELIESAVDYGVVVRPPRSDIYYRAFIDVSGGVRDSAACAIAHREDETAVLDCLVEVPSPHDPNAATRQMADVIKSYGLTDATGDKYAAQWTVEAFAKYGITYQHSERDRSAIYLECLPLFTSGRVRLLDHKRLVGQFASLERRTSSLGRDRVDHGPNGHDDLCNAAAGALVMGEDPLAIWDRLGEDSTPIFVPAGW
jgi:hypothetical protein